MVNIPIIQCPQCDGPITITTKQAAQVLRGSNKTNLTSEQAKLIRKKRKTWNKKTT
jgi:hypothetical protein